MFSLSPTSKLNLKTELVGCHAGNLNRGQGLGFLVGNTVIDKGKLQRFATAVAGLATTIGPVMLAWGVTTFDGQADNGHVAAQTARTCAVTKQQEAAIASVFETFGFELGCSFNITVNVGKHIALLISP